MALIKCSECGSEVSSRATACPKCGNPIAAEREVEATGTAITTTQATAKKFKGQKLLAGGLCILGFVVIGKNGDYGPKLESLLTGFGGFLILVGILLFFAAKVGAWWHHG